MTHTYPVRRRTPLAIAVAGLSLSSLAALPASAQIRGEVVGPGATRMPIAVPALKRTGGEERTKAADDFVRIVRADLERSGLFRIIEPDAYIYDPEQSGITPDAVNFDNWIAVGALGLVLGGYDGTRNGLVIETRFFDVADRSSTGGRRLSGGLDDVARMAHRMADAVMEFVTGLPGPFDSRIAFVSNRERHFREVHAYTFDGHLRPVTRHHSITMAPAWHPSNNALVFTSFRGGKPVLYSIDYATGQDTRIASKMGVNVGGEWSPDGTKLLLARETAGNTDVFVLDPARATTQQLTRHWGIDVNPVWSPDGSRIAFCSSRSGKPQIYTMAADGQEVQRLTFTGDYNCAPDWSPDGRHIAFAGRRQGRFQIFVISARGGSARQVTFAGSNEDPSWSPDSRYIAFSGKRGEHRKLYMVDISGRWETQLTDGRGDDTSPNWSGRLD